MSKETETRVGEWAFTRKNGAHLGVNRWESSWVSAASWPYATRHRRRMEDIEVDWTEKLFVVDTLHKVEEKEKEKAIRRQ